jgi:hypothetical protein
MTGAVPNIRDCAGADKSSGEVMGLIAYSDSDRRLVLRRQEDTLQEMSWAESPTSTDIGLSCRDDFSSPR